VTAEYARPYRGENPGPGKDDRTRAWTPDPELENSLGGMRLSAELTSVSSLVRISRLPTLQFGNLISLETNRLPKLEVFPTPPLLLKKAIDCISFTPSILFSPKLR
jgi:hypothetical protein